MKRDARQASTSLDPLKADDPIRASTLAGEGIEAALDEIGAAITGLPRQAPRAARRRSIGGRRTALLVTAVILVISAGIATGAAVWSARTGQFPTKAEEAIEGPGEELDPAAPDYRAVALQIASDIPYPEGYESWRDFLISEQVRTNDPGGVETTGALHGWFAASAFCAWVQTWRQAATAGDANATAQAAQMIAQAPNWKAVTDEDPDPDPSAPNDPGAETGTLFGWLLPYRDAVLAGDRTRVEHLLAAGYGGGKCWLSDPDWMAQVRAHEGWGTRSPSALAQRYEQFLASVRP